MRDAGLLLASKLNTIVASPALPCAQDLDDSFFTSTAEFIIASELTGLHWNTDASGFLS